MTVADILKAARLVNARLATAESCTSGLLAAALTEPPGSSDVFMGGIVAYSNTVKENLLHVPASILAAHGAVSEAVAAKMARGALIAFPEATLTLSITGIAGPGGGTQDKPVGRVCFGIAKRDQGVRAQTIDFGALGRTRVREAATQHALNMILKDLRTA